MLSRASVSVRAVCALTTICADAKYHVMKDALAAAYGEKGVDYYSYEPFQVYNSVAVAEMGWTSTVGDLWRTGGDIRPSWKSILNNAHANNKWAPNARPGHYNDADMLEVRRPRSPQGRAVAWQPRLPWGRGAAADAAAVADWERTADTRRAAQPLRPLVPSVSSHRPLPLRPPPPMPLVFPAASSHAALHRCLMKSPLIIGSDVRGLPAESLAVLKNKWLIALNQDGLGIQGTLRAVMDQHGRSAVARPAAEGQESAAESPQTGPRAGSAFVGNCSFGTAPAEQQWQIVEGAGAAGARLVAVGGKSFLARGTGNEVVATAGCTASSTKGCGRCVASAAAAAAFVRHCCWLLAAQLRQPIGSLTGPSPSPRPRPRCSALPSGTSARPTSLSPRSATRTTRPPAWPTTEARCTWRPAVLKPATRRRRRTAQRATAGSHRSPTSSSTSTRSSNAAPPPPDRTALAFHALPVNPRSARSSARSSPRGAKSSPFSWGDGGAGSSPWPGQTFKPRSETTRGTSPPTSRCA